jgi:hypothetical protein
LGEDESGSNPALESERVKILSTITVSHCLIATKKTQTEAIRGRAVAETESMR